MKFDLDHLPVRQQNELLRVRDTLLAEFEMALTAGGGGTQPWRRNGRVLKIILFGSYARDDWVDEPESGYLSDYDLLLIVSHEKLTDIADYWWVAEDKILRDPNIGRIVNIIVHPLAEVNAALERGEYFWSEIIRDGVVLYELPGHPLVSAAPLEVEAIHAAAKIHLTSWLPKIGSALKLAEYARADGEMNDSAFLLHQAVERAYVCFLLVHKLYAPRSHNIKFLRSVAEDADRTLVAAWPREERADRRRFEVLKRAYVEARYSSHYTVTEADLEALTAHAVRLRDLVEASCRKRLEALAAGEA